MRYYNNNDWTRIACFISLLFLASYYKSEAFAVSINNHGAKKARNTRGGYTTPLSVMKETGMEEVPYQNGFVINGSYKHEVDENDEEDEDVLVTAEFIAETNLPTDLGMFRLRAYRHPNNSEFSGNEPCVIYSPEKPIMGPSVKKGNVNVRVHDQCLTSEVFGSQRCDCRDQLRMALKFIKENGGAIIYLQQEGRGIGLANKVAAYSLQDDGMDTVDANLHLGFPEDLRSYGMIPSILEDLEISSINLLTNNPRKVDRLSSLGVHVEEIVPMVIPQANIHNRRYLEAKHERMNHMNLRDMLLVKTKGEKADVLPKNGVMAPIAPIISGSKSASLAVDQAAGVTAREDGYCFGRESVEKAIAAVAEGEMVCVVDDMDRENEGDFIMAANACTPEAMAKIIRYSSGVICVAMENDRMEELDLPSMVSNNQDPKETAFSITVDATPEHGISTGISATDRSRTVQLLADPKTMASDFVRPGHIFPLRAKANGVLERDGHTEATVDLSRLAGRGPCGVLCEIVSEENPTEMARLPELIRFCKEHNLVLTSIVDLQQYRRDTEPQQQHKER
eukprot:CAMPEP_0194129650 /NCGR_PEP_ID=MMETSP0152-20130528/862_1 /TAXON_ID=1049557 /ORGANISM="Thalassiothrix antarctica, Strain L6-D1" /LENGTH=564 /DNA_ID=CAMNT_0038823951 /DNA_START=183 /DNA_END=1877 /DNA_ORIENTATION=+